MLAYFKYNKKGENMKKIILILAFVFCVFGGNLLSSSLISKAEEIKIDDVSYNEIYINSTQDFVSTFSLSSTYNNSNIKIILNNDLDFSNTDLSTLYQTKRTFTGFFDGNGYTISNITLSSDMYYYGLIPYASGAIIQNLRVAGEVTININETNTNPLYVGVIVGYGENVQISNCELYNAELIITDETVENISTLTDNYKYNQIILPTYSNITFGGIIGQATSFTSSGFTNQKSIIKDCVNYYDINITINKNSRIAVGGIVGSLTNGSMILDCLNFGDINITNSVLTNVDNKFSQYFGGICGEIDGTTTQITNTCYGGNILFLNDTSTIDCYRGTIIGYLNCPQASTNYNVNFSYWTQGALNFYGAGYSLTSEKLQLTAVINRSFLTNSDNFDTRELGFNFLDCWTMVNSEILLQNFQNYNYSFNTNLDVSNIIESATFSIDGSSSNQTITTKFGNEITITIDFADTYNGYYKLESILINTNNPLDTEYYQVNEILDSNEKISGYKIILKANDATDGTYSFTLSTIPYSCQVTISDDAIANNQGGIRVVGASSSTSSMNINFSDTNRSMDIQAVNNGIYTFSYWEIYYRDNNGDFTKEGTLSDSISQSSTLNIVFGTSPFNQEFKLVAYFTDENAVLVSFDGINSDNIKTISLGGNLYTGQAIAVSPTSTSIILEITTNSGYELNVNSFVEYIERLYGDNSTDTLIVSEPAVNEDNETTYQFRLNMRYMQDNISSNQLALSLIVDKDGSGGGGSLLWLYILIPVVVGVGVGLALFFIIRNKKGGKGGRKAKTNKKDDNYLDYYV